MYMSPDEFPLPWEYRGLHFEGLLGAPPDDVARAHDRLPRLREHRPHAGRLPPGRRAPHPQHRPPPRQHALRHGEPRGLVGVVHRRDGVAARQGAGRGDHAGDREGAVRGARDGHGPVHVREHDIGGPPDGRRADRGRGGAAQGLPRAVRGPAVPAAPAAPAGAGIGRAPRRRRHDGRAPDEEPTTRRRARSRPTPRASWTTCARSRERASRCWCASSWPTTARGCERCRCGRRTGRSTCRGSRASSAAAATRRRRASRRRVPYDELVDQLRSHVREQLTHR